MTLSPFLLQAAGSLAAILALAGLAHWLKLGAAPVMTDEDSVRRAAGEAEAGFIAIDAARDAKGRAGLARDAHARIMVIKHHGNRYAGRVLGPKAQARLQGDPGETALEVDCGEARFGKVFLIIPDAQAWAAAINALNVAHDA